MLRALDFDRGDGGSFERGEEHAAERISDRVAVAGLEGLGDEFGVSVCGCRLILDEGLRHFETTVTNWHMLKADRGERRAESYALSDFRFLTLRHLLKAPGSPWRAWFRVQRRKPRDQRRDFKNSQRTGNKHHSAGLCKRQLPRYRAVCALRFPAPPAPRSIRANLR